MSIEVRPAGSERVEDLAGAMGRAFAGDPILVWPFIGSLEPDEEKAIAVFRLLLTQYVDAGVAWESSDGKAGAVWVPPGRIDVFVAMDLATRPPIAALTDDDGARYEAMWDWMGSHVPDEPIWFLDMLGVDPRSQGKGYGAALLAIGVEAARRDGVPAFCETSSKENAQFYEHHGFAVVEHGDAPGGGPHVWFMRREP